MSHIKRKTIVPIWFIIIYRILRYKSYRKSHLRFLKESFSPHITLKEKLLLIERIHGISYQVESASTELETLRFITDFLCLGDQVGGKIAEIGCYKGGSSCKFSLAARLGGRKFVLFDSFEGIPANNEVNKHNIDSREEVTFAKGSYLGTLSEVKNNIAKYGAIEQCEFVKGFVEDTLPNLKEQFCAVYLDVDLASATKTCIKYIYPLLAIGGVMYSQDGHLPLVIEVFNDDEFWKNQIGIPKPDIEGLGNEKLIRIVKK